MKTIPSLLLAGTVLLSAVSCTNLEFQKTKSGLLYKILSDGRGNTAKPGEFLKIDVVEKVRDSVLSSSYGSVPFYLRVDSVGPVYSFMEVMPKVRKGDSVVIVFRADSLQKRSNGSLPPFLKKKDKLTLSFKILDVYASEDLVNADRQKEMDKEKAKESKEVEKYLADNKIAAEKTEKGTFVLVKDAGTGPQADSGKEVFVRYTGKYLPSGKVFESNMNGPADPISFVIGQGGMIEGWDDGLRKFKKGGKGTLYIPSFLAYGPNAKPPMKPFQNLMFDVEVVDVREPQKPTGPAGMPPMNIPQARPAQPAHR